MNFKGKGKEIITVLSIIGIACAVFFNLKYNNMYGTLTDDVIKIQGNYVPYLFIAIALISLIATNYFNEEKTREEISLIRDSPKVKKWKSSKEAYPYLKLKIKDTKIIMNTYFPNISSDDLNLDDSEKPISIYEEWINSSISSQWIDVISPEVLFDTRFDLLFKMKNKEIPQKKHTMYVLTHKNICPNFAIMKYTSGKEEVFWGWTHRIDNTDNEDNFYIYSSEESYLIDFYKKLFTKLQLQPTWNNEIINSTFPHEKPVISNFTESSIVNKTGNWVTLSFDKDHQIKNFGVYRLHYDEGHSGTKVANMVGYTFNEKLELVENAHHSEDKNEISHYENKMFIEYGRGNESNSEKGFCFYEFKKVDIQNGEENNTINGFFIGKDEYISNKIFGVMDNRINIDFDIIIKKGNKCPDNIKKMFYELIKSPEFNIYTKDMPNLKNNSYNFISSMPD